MNVLPLVSAFILLFAIGSYTLIHQVRAALQEKEHFSASMNLHRKVVSKMQGKKYKEHKGQNLHPPKLAVQVKTDSTFLSPRDRINPITERKLNISKLKTESNPKLEKVACDLIFNIYRMSPVYQQNMEEEVVSTLIQMIKANPSINTFEELLPKIPPEKYPLFYKLIKGTQTYELHTNRGIPPLEEFITLETTKQAKPIDFCYASRALLEVVFDETLAPQIINQEKHKWELEHKHIPLTKQELEVFLLGCRKNFSDYDHLFYFSTTQSKLSKNVIQDNKTKVRIKIKK